MLLKKIINEWKTWRVVRKTVKANREKFESLGFDIDWIGRLYTIINIPDEIMSMPIKTNKDAGVQRQMIDSYIKNGLSDINNLLIELHLSDLIIYPYLYERFEHTDSILFILAPDRKYTKPIWVFLYFLGLATIIMGLIFLIFFLISII